MGDLEGLALGGVDGLGVGKIEVPVDIGLGEIDQLAVQVPSK